jgi:SSS family solute:Na+ symporter
MPGIISWQLYKAQLTAPGATTDMAYPLLIKNLVGPGLRGFILAAIAGAVISTLGSLLNSVATLLTMDIYKRHINKNADQKTVVRLGRWATLVFVVAVCFIAPQLGNPKFKGIFNYIQEFQGFISPGILAAFVFGLFIKKTPRAAGVVALLLNAPIYGLLMWKFSSIAFLNRMAITFAVLLVVLAVMTVLKPLKVPVVMPVQQGFDMTPSRAVKWLGPLVVALTIVLYIIFW